MDHRGRRWGVPTIRTDPRGGSLPGGRSDSPDEALWAASGIAALVHLVLDEYESNRVQRNLLADVDAVRIPVERALGLLQHARATAVDATGMHSQMSTALHVEWQRVLDRHHELGEGEITERSLGDVIGPITRPRIRRPGGVEGRDREALVQELNRSLEQRAEQIMTTLHGTASNVQHEWELFGPDLEGIRFDVGRGSVWWNRAAKFGGRAALSMGSVWVGTAVGAAIGGGPPGAIVGFLTMSAVVLMGSVAIPLFDKVMDRFVRSRAEVIRRRRRELATKLGPALDEIEAHARDALATHVITVRAAAGAVIAGRRAEEAAAREIIYDLIGAIECVQSSLADLDLATVKALAELADVLGPLSCTSGVSPSGSCEHRDRR